MSAQPTPAAAPDHVNIEVDGRAIAVPKGSMIIQAADKIGVPIPRFCYHDKLSIAANCRMCLVEVEKAPKPMPACATPVAEGMKVFTRSAKALSAQRNVMEFLLINHPLDCPICDQGGECELQDLSIGYGRSVSRFVERKRVVADEDLGPLIATEMTRCIQCTRCVRFMGEIAGTYELGGMERGEHLEIGTYIGKTLESELSGNVIDVCPVGALTNKVFRFRARPWELIARESIGYHDALGSNLWMHLRRGEVMRTVPRDNEAINECWLSDRDRYSHQGLYAADRLAKPMIKRNNVWAEVDWDTAIRFAGESLKRVRGDEIGVLVQPATSNEEGYLLAQLASALGTRSIDHRLRALDFADGAAAKPFEMSIADIEKASAILMIGCDPRGEAPLLAHRIRKAQRRGAKVYAINPVDFDFNFDLAGKTIAAPSAMFDALLGHARAAKDAGYAGEAGAFADALSSANADDASRGLIKALTDASSSVVLLGHVAAAHPQSSWLRAAAAFIAKATNSALDALPIGANAIGLARMGVLPHADGLDARAMMVEPRKAYVLYNAEPPHDFADGAQAVAALRRAEAVVAFSTFASETLKQVATVILPIGALPEIDATLTNVEGVDQTVAAGGKLPAESRPGWKVLRALGASLGFSGFDFTEIAEVRVAMAKHEPRAHAPTGKLAERAATPAIARGSFARIATVPTYRLDAVLRRAAALQEHPLSRAPVLALNPEDALALGLGNGAHARVANGASSVELAVEATPRVPRGAVWIDGAHDTTAALGAMGTALEITKVSA